MKNHLAGTIPSKAGSFVLCPLGIQVTAAKLCSRVVYVSVTHEEGDETHALPVVKGKLATSYKSHLPSAAIVRSLSNGRVWERRGLALRELQKGTLWSRAPIERVLFLEGE
ncbi:hypothetical protein NPIL_627231 [Nephila pilipes]|uniref:Uncharacterized protein n=1 Tax=Nephila pilipes TaxID=299642 RepID=A0A8X6N676_NEPPI|nr:hypothetical protein NPIL_627231 [Nephila pilipes]